MNEAIELVKARLTNRKALLATHVKARDVEQSNVEMLMSQVEDLELALEKLGYIPE